MYLHAQLGTTTFARQRALYTLIANGQINFAGYQKKKIYGTLTCKAGKLMKTQNRVFFTDEQEAIASDYRPCARCMPEKYRLWKLQNGTI
ncbi:MAG TPA: Ada metal-binding domain-containing protein [Mucilaginibacter sp.]